MAQTSLWMSGLQINRRNRRTRSPWQSLLFLRRPDTQSSVWATPPGLRSNKRIRRTSSLRQSLLCLRHPDTQSSVWATPPKATASGTRRLGDAGTRGNTRANVSTITSCCSATQTSKAMSGPPCHPLVGSGIRIGKSRQSPDDIVHVLDHLHLVLRQQFPKHRSTLWDANSSDQRACC